MSKVYQYVTDRVTDMLAQGTVAWQRPWSGTQMAPRPYEGRPYRGCNYFFLSMLPFAVPVFLTMKKIKALGGTIKAGEEKRYYPVFLFLPAKFEKRNPVTGKKETQSVPILRYFNVWNIEQCEGIPMPKYVKDHENAKRDFNSIDAAENAIAGYRNAPPIKHGGNVACYSPSLDTVTSPTREQFTSESGYYSTMFHELGHSTGHKTRLNRKEVNDPISFGSHAYSQEELVAELTAAFLCAECGIDNTLENSAAYIASWMKALRDDPKMFMIAAGRAYKAADHILGREYVADTETAQAVAETA